MAKQFKPGSPGGSTSAKGKQINVQDMIDHIGNTINNIKREFNLSETVDAEFEVIESKLHDPEGSTLTEIQDVDYGWMEEVAKERLKFLKNFPCKIEFIEEAAPVDEKAFNKLIPKA